MRKSKILFCLLVPCAFLLAKRGKDDVNNPAYYEAIINKVTHQTAKQIYKEKNLSCSGTGGGAAYAVMKLSLDFDYSGKEELDVRSARELIVYIVNTYLDNINSNKVLRPYLEVFPFTAKNVEITLYINKPNRDKVDPDKICTISAYDGVVKYKKRPERHITIEMMESFTEAEKLANDRILAFGASKMETWLRYDFREPHVGAKLIKREKEILKGEESL